MFIKRNKSRPSLRTRETDELPSSPLARSTFTAGAGIDDEPSSSAAPSPAAPSTGDDEEGLGSVMERKKAKNKEKRSSGLTKGSRLSFGGPGDEGEDGTPGFKPRKSLLSQQVKLPSTPATEPVASSSTPSYSSAYLDELKASTPSRGPRRPTVDDGDDDEEDGTGLSQLAREKYASRMVEDTTAGIPDDAAIAAAKQKRQAALEAKKHGLGEDYISLSGGQVAVYDGDSGPHPESRLMREEDEGEEGDEELADFTEANERTYLGKSANKAAARRRKGEMDELIADREAESEDDEETKEWEMAQARRAGHYEPEEHSRSVQKGYRPAPIPRIRPMPTMAPAQARIAKAMAELRVRKAEDESNLEIASRDLAILEGQERDLRLEVERVEAKREWVEEFRGWVEMLGGFLEEKVPKLDDIEKDALHHYDERAKMVSARRTADDSDDLSLFLGAPRPEQTEEVDDMGRSRDNIAEAGPSSGVRRVRREERDARRMRRRDKRSRLPRPPPEEEEGFSTDGTLAEGDADDYRAAQRHLDSRVRGLLDDVRAEDFRDPNKGLAVRFADWRRRYEDEYVNAFGGLGLVHAWEFYARGEMVGWEPLRTFAPLEAFHWFTSIHAYNRPRPPPTNGHSQDDDMDTDEPPLGPEGDLMPEMISKTVIPLLVKMFENGAYDPYSAAQTRRAVDLCEVVEGLLGKDSRKFTALLKAVLTVYHEEVVALTATISACLVSDAIPPPAFDPASRPALHRYVRRRIKLLRNMLLWRSHAASEVKELAVRLVTDVIRPVLERSWDSGGREIGMKVLQASAGILPHDLQSFLLTGPRR